MTSGIERRNHLMWYLSIDLATGIRCLAVERSPPAGRVYIRSSIDPASRSAGALLRSAGRKAKLTSDHHVVKCVWFRTSLTRACLHFC